MNAHDPARDKPRVSGASPEPVEFRFILSVLGKVEPTIWTKAQAVGIATHSRLRQARNEDLTICAIKHQQFRRSRNKDSVAPDREAGGACEIVRDDFRFGSQEFQLAARFEN